MGYRGKTQERDRARQLRAGGMTMAVIAEELGVAKGTVSIWCRDIAVPAGPRVRARARGPNALQRAKQAQIDGALIAGVERMGGLADRDLMIAGVALYAGEGSKQDGDVKFTNTDPAMVTLFCHWLRTFFDIDERRLRVHLYLHADLDLHQAIGFWHAVTGIPPDQFIAPYRAVADPTHRQRRHVHDCVGVRYSCSATHRAVMGLVHALLGAPFRGSSIGGALDC